MKRRLFVAAWLPPRAREEAAEVLERLRGAAADVKWVPPENLHVTLRFLGDVAQERIEGLITGLSQELSSADSFPVRLGRLGAFPARGTPRVIWIGLEEGAVEVADLAARTERGLARAGLLGEREKRPFRAHVTLGRPRRPGGLSRLVDLLEELSFSGRTHLLEEVILAESQLSPRGATYQAVARVPLRGKPTTDTTCH